MLDASVKLEYVVPLDDVIAAELVCEFPAKIPP